MVFQLRSLRLAPLWHRTPATIHAAAANTVFGTGCSRLACIKPHDNIAVYLSGPRPLGEITAVSSLRARAQQMRARRPDQPVKLVDRTQHDAAFVGEKDQGLAGFQHALRLLITPFKILCRLFTRTM